MTYRSVLVACHELLPAESFHTLMAFSDQGRSNAAALVAHETFNAAGQRLLDDRMLTVVLVMVFITSLLGPVLTERLLPA
jgi:hypothetical protein